MLIPRIRNRDTAGKNSSRKNCAVITRRDYKFDTRVVRFHNVYGPLGTYEGGKEKAPAAICRKVALAQDHGEIEIWGDGEQTRSFMYIDDCVEGLIRMMASGCADALNLGTDELVTINGLVDIVSKIAGKRLTKRHNLNRPQGVRGRNSDNSLLQRVLGWQPSIPLKQGVALTYRWIHQDLATAGRIKSHGSSVGGLRAKSLLHGLNWIFHLCSAPYNFARAQSPDRRVRLRGWTKRWLQHVWTTHRYRAPSLRARMRSGEHTHGSRSQYLFSSGRPIWLLSRLLPCWGTGHTHSCRSASAFITPPTQSC